MPHPFRSQLFYPVHKAHSLNSLFKFNTPKPAPVIGAGFLFDITMKTIVLAVSVYGDDFAFLHKTESGNFLVACNIDQYSEKFYHFLDLCYNQIISCTFGDRPLFELTPVGYNILSSNFVVNRDTKKLLLQKVSYRNRLIWNFTENL